MTIKARLLVCLSLLAVAMLVMIVTAFSALTSISKRTESIVADRLLPVDHLKTVSDMYAVEIVDTTHKVRSGALDWAAGAKAIDTALATIDTRWRTYEATRLTPEEKTLTEIFDRARIASDASIRDLVQIATSGQGRTRTLCRYQALLISRSPRRANQRLDQAAAFRG
ncbi:hypothetical protein BTE77_08215 [Ensifer adhaerens]|nr:hypothetical protein BTE77_08215 [Ensifer adhaerens]